VIAPLLQVSTYLSRQDRTRTSSPTTVRTDRAVAVSVAGPTRRGD
jgi:hypothetical protein